MKYLLTCLILIVLILNGYAQGFLNYMNLDTKLLAKIGSAKKNYEVFKGSDVIVLKWIDTTYNCRVEIQINPNTNIPVFIYFTPDNTVSYERFIVLLNDKFNRTTIINWEDSNNVKLIGTHGYYTCVTKVSNTINTEYSFLFTNCAID